MHTAENPADALAAQILDNFAVIVAVTAVGPS
jgi:hypothetical protein